MKRRYRLRLARLKVKTRKIRRLGHKLSGSLLCSPRCEHCGRDFNSKGEMAGRDYADTWNWIDPISCAEVVIQEIIE